MMNKNNNIIRNSAVQHKYTELNIVSKTKDTCFYINLIEPFNYGVIVNINDFDTQQRYDDIVKQIKKITKTKLTIF